MNCHSFVSTWLLVNQRTFLLRPQWPPLSELSYTRSPVTPSTYLTLSTGHPSLWLFIYLFILFLHSLRSLGLKQPIGCHNNHHHQSSSVICQTTGPKPLPTRFFHIVWSRASSFNWQYPLLSLRSSSSFLLLLPCLLFTFICPFIFPSITCCRRQFLHKMWPIQLACRFLISCRIFLCSLTLSNTSSFLTTEYVLSVGWFFSVVCDNWISP